MNTCNRFRSMTVGAALAGLSLGMLAPNNASAVTLNATAGGTFTFNYDRDALALAGYQQIIDNTDPLNPVYAPNSPSHPGYYASSFWDSVASDYTTRADGYFTTNNGHSEIPAASLVHNLVTISSTASNGDLPGQAANRHVKELGENFGIDSVTLAGTGTSASTNALGMTGVQGFWLPYYGASGGNLFYGDFSLRYGKTARQTAWTNADITDRTPSGWYLQNNISFAAVAYDLDNLSLVYTDAQNWMLQGDLLNSPSNSDFIKSAVLADLGNFCLGVGSYAGCSNPVVATVPLPGAVWLFAGGLSGLRIISRRNRRMA